MIKNYFLLGSLLCSMGAFSQSTVWKHTGWEARISDKGYLEYCCPLKLFEPKN